MCVLFLLGDGTHSGWQESGQLLIGGSPCAPPSPPPPAWVGSRPPLMFPLNPFWKERQRLALQPGGSLQLNLTPNNPPLQVGAEGQRCSPKEASVFLPHLLSVVFSPPLALPSLQVSNGWEVLLVVPAPAPRSPPSFPPKAPNSWAPHGGHLHCLGSVVGLPRGGGGGTMAAFVGRAAPRSSLEWGVGRERERGRVGGSLAGRRGICPRVVSAGVWALLMRVSLGPA